MDRERRLLFTWHGAKERANLRKHGVSFKLAGSIFRDSAIATSFDAEHSDGEERWFSVGQARNGVILAVSYTWREIDRENVLIRIISARKATRSEISGYEESFT